MAKKNLILNRIKTPDGTILTSEFIHDLKTHVDDNGETYMVDGGTVYLRRNATQIPYEELSLYDDEPFDVIRNYVKWGTNGKEGNNPVQYIPLKQLGDEHLQAILDTQKYISKKLKGYLISEKLYRLRCMNRSEC